MPHGRAGRSTRADPQPVGAAADDGTGCVTTVPRDQQAVPDRARIQSAHRAAVLERDGDLHHVIRARDQPRCELLPPDRELRGARYLDDNGPGVAADLAHQVGHFGGKRERVRSESRPQQHQPLKRGDR